MSLGGSRRPLQPQPGPCDKCGAQVLWVRHVATGKKMPIELAEHGSLYLEQDGAHVDDLGPKATTWTGRRWRCHFETCPETRGYRRARGLPEPEPTHAR